MNNPKRLLPQATKTAKVHAQDLRQAMTDAEHKLWYHLRNRRLAGYKFRRQVPIGCYIADFVCLNPKLIVEADGGQHLAQHHHDKQRSAYLQQQGFAVLRFWNDEILTQTETVLQVIADKLDELAKNQS